MTKYFNKLFCWIPIFVLGYLIFLFFKNRYRSRPYETVIAAAALGASLKGIFMTNLMPYGAFLLLLDMVVLYKFLNDYFKQKALVAIAFSVFAGLYFGISIFAIRGQSYYPVQTKMGSIHSSPTIGKAYENTLKFLESRVQENEKVLILPDGQILNFLSNRKSDDYLSEMFMPDYMETAGEDKLIQKIAEANIDYIIVTKRDVKEFFGYGRENKIFGKDYGIKTMNYIQSKYARLTTDGDGEYIKIYGPTYLSAAYRPAPANP
jgi:hypothetical protein